jgi:hypothetical protein
MFDKEETDILNDMINDANESELELALQGNISKNKNIKSESDQTYEESFFIQYLVDIKTKREKFSRKIEKFSKIMHKLSKKKRKKMFKFLRYELYKLHDLSCDLVTLMRLWDENRRLEFKQLVDESFLFDLDPTYIFDYKQYIFDPKYSNFFQLRVDEPSQFLLFLSYGFRRNPIINLISRKDFAIYPLDLSSQALNFRFVSESAKFYNFMV